MDAIKKFVKEHKIVTALIILFLAALISVFVIYQIMFTYKEDERLNGKKEVEINDASQNTIKDNISKKENVNKIDINIVTKQISFLVDVKKGTSKKDAKKLSDDILNELSDEEKSYYDVQVIYECTECEDDNTYPIIGYKHKTSKSIVWSNN